MSKFTTEHTTILVEGAKCKLISNVSFQSFSEGILGLGEISSVSTPKNTLSVMFDLEGFTNFCKQIDPQLAVPDYLSQFLKWIFQEIKIQLTNRTFPEGIDAWADLPFLSKFLGDGLLFLWDTDKLHPVEIANVVVSMLELCQNYQEKFLNKIQNSIVEPPTKLRCGIARGIAYSVGDGNDFVGPCINMSARLQKLHSHSFCFSRRGIDLDIMEGLYKDNFIVKRVDIPGIGSNELVCILKAEYEALSDKEKSNFK